MSTTTGSTTPEMQSFSAPNSIYIYLITLELASIGIKYQGLSTNPFQEPHLSMLLFLIAVFCHAIAQTAKINRPIAIIFHVSGVIACEALLWILVAEFWWWIIINLLPFLVAAVCFCYKDICQLLSTLLGICFLCILLLTCSRVAQTGLNANPVPDLEAQEGIDAQMPDLEPANIM